MTFLPIVARELRVAARRRAAHWNRVVAALLALVVCTFVFANLARGSQAELGLVLFVSLAWLAMIFCALAGARLTADTISEERREGTLGLLFLTDLKGYDIVLGKLAASSLNAIYSLLAIVPVLGGSLLFGGVTGRQFGLTVLVLLNTLFFSLALGIGVSTGLTNGRRAMLVTVALVAAVVVGPFIGLWVFLARTNFSGPGLPPLEWLIPSPAFALFVATTPPRMPGISLQQFFWPSMSFVFGLGVLCLTVSSFTVPRIWHDRPATSWRARWQQFRQRLAFGNGEVRRRLRARLLARGPVFWLTSRERLKPWLVWGSLGLAGLVWLGGGYAFGNDWNDTGVYLSFSQALYGLLKLWIAAAVVVRLAEDRRSAALELLLTTPLTLGDILGGLRRTLQRQFLWPLLAVLALDGVFCHAALQRDYGDSGMVLAVYAARMSLLVLDAFTLWRLGPWVAVTARHPNQAAASLLVRVCVIPWLIFVALAMGVALLEAWGVHRLEVSEGLALGGWFGLGLANDVFWLIYAQRQLVSGHFREAAAARPEGLVARWWRRAGRLWGNRAQSG